MTDVPGLPTVHGTLVDPSGVVLGRTEVHRGEPRPRLEFRPSIDLADAAHPELAERLRGSFPEHRLSVSDRGLAAALEQAGARRIRRSQQMALRPRASREPGICRLDGIEIAPMQETPERYADLLLRAYPPDHPDHDEDVADLSAATAMIAGCFDGSVVGPFDPAASAEARSPSGAPVGAVVVSEMPVDEAYPGGPWVTELFIDPAYQRQGIGRALMDHAIRRLRANGLGELGLSVHVDNPARVLYEDLGFVARSSWTTFVL